MNGTAAPLTLFLLVACEPPDDGDPHDTGPTTTFTVPTGHYPLDDVLRFNHVQARGTHNSTHLEPANPVDPSHEYSQRPLTEQLDLQGVRQFELDLHLRKDGAIEVFHIPALDEETTCRQFTDCLQELKDWSNANPLHTPIVIWMELKDDVDAATVDYQSFDGEIDRVEEHILSVLPRFRVLTPDEVRGSYASVSEAIEAEGWPTLGALRGRFVFSLLEDGPHRDAYLAGRENLAGALLFVDGHDGTQPWDAMFKINDAQAESARIQDLVGKGFVVTCNADAADDSAADNAAKRDASLASGAQYLSSDRPAADSGGDGYWLEIPGGAPARCNPVSAPAACTAGDVESLP